MGDATMDWSMSAAATQQGEVSARNEAFWNELCGSTLAKRLGVADDSKQSLKRFDDWFFAFYPYLFAHIPFAELKDREVLEVGLGYGSVSQRLAEEGARYTGLDIALGPVAMVNHRLAQTGLLGAARQGSILAAPFADARFDAVVAIGCLHHTGDMQRAIEECRRVLRPGGMLIFMVYYAFSYRRFLLAPVATFRHALRERAGYRGVFGIGDEDQRAAYDTNVAGDSAPHTDWISIRSLQHMCRNFAAFTGRLENVGSPFGSLRLRSALLRSPLARHMGRDLYAMATK
jgi:SAM-dependent methyltransferase